MSERTSEQSEQSRKPSQAEGEREAGSTAGMTRSRPSQAEGERETVEEDLHKQGLAQ